MSMPIFYAEESAEIYNFPKRSDRADARLEKGRLRRLRLRAEISWRRYLPIHR